MLFVEIFYFYHWWPSCSVEWNYFSNFGTGHERNISVKVF